MRNQSQKKCRIFPLQRITYLTCIASIVLSWYPSFKTGVQLILLFSMILQFYCEGGKPYSVLFVMVFLFNILQFWWLELFFTIILTFYLIWCKFYEIRIIDKGPFNAGYRQVTIGNQKIGIFYPTSEKGQPALWVQTKDCYKNMYDFTFMNPLQTRWIPLKAFQACTSYMNRVEIPAQTGTGLQAPNPEQNQFQVILFSHGLSCNMTSYSSYCSWLASQGYIVVSVEHTNDFIRVVYDEQFLKRKDLLKKMLYMVANQGLQARAEEMGRVYESLISNQLLKYAFPQVERISLKKVHFFGHSFGGATCIQTIVNLSAKKVDLSLVGHILAIDPYFYPLSKHTLEHSFDQNITIVNSESFINFLPPDLGIKKIFRTLIENSPSKVMLFALMGSNHIFSTDYSFVCGTGLAAIRKVKNLHQFETFISMLQLITESALNGHGQEQILMKADEKFDSEQLKRKEVCVKVEDRYLTA